MAHDVHAATKKGILANKTLWLLIGVGVFVLVGFVLPPPQSLKDLIAKQGYLEQMVKWHVAHDLESAARKTMMVLGIVPMAIIFFATEAIPIGLTGVLMPILAYFLNLLPKQMVGKSFAGDAPMFLLGVLAMGVVVVEVGLHKRLATWILGWTRGFTVPILVLCLSMAMIGSFISAHAMCAFMTPVIMAVYYGAVVAKSGDGTLRHDPALAKFLLFSLCYALNVGGVGSPAAGGRNAIMMGFWDSYKVPMDFFTWMKYGFPLVPVLGFVVFIYMFFSFGRKVETKDLTPGLSAIKEETIRMGKMGYKDYTTLGMMLLILLLWIVGGHDLGLGGPSLLALLIPVIFRITPWQKVLHGISWDAWFMYCGSLTLGELLKESGAAIWIATVVLDGLHYLGVTKGLGLWVGISAFSGLMTNFMSDAGVTALLGPITVPMGIMSGHPAEPWASGLATAFATSFAHFLIVGTPNNAIVYALGTYPDTGRSAIEPSDFIKYGFVLWILSLLVVWTLGFMVIFPIVGFPQGILEVARNVLQSGVK